MGCKTLRKIGRQTVIGSLHLSFSFLASRFLIAIGRLLVIHLLRAEDYGLLVAVLAVQNLVLLFSDLRLNAALIKHLSANLEREDLGRAAEITRQFLTMKIVLAGLCFLLTLALSNFFVAQFSSNIGVRSLYVMASMGVFGTTFSEAFQSIFIGIQRTDLLVFVSLAYSLGKASMAPLLILAGFGLRGAVIGDVLPGYVLTLLAIFLLLRETNLLRKPKTRLEGVSFYRGAIEYSLPLWVELFSSELFLASIPLVLVHSKNVGEVAYFNAAFLIYSLLVGVLCYAPSDAIWPTLSRIHTSKDQPKLRRVVMLSSVYLTFITAPTCILLWALSNDLLSVLFPLEYGRSVTSLKLLALAIPISGFAQLVKGFLLATDNTKAAGKLALGSAVSGFLLLALLSPKWGGAGAAASMLAFYLVYGCLGWIYYCGRSVISFPSRRIALIGLSALLSGLTTIKMLDLVGASGITNLFLGSIISLLSYMMISLALGSLTVKDLHDLESAVSGTFLQVTIHTLIMLLERISRVLKRTHRFRDPKAAPSPLN